MTPLVNEALDALVQLRTQQCFPPKGTARPFPEMPPAVSVGLHVDADASRAAEVFRACGFEVRSLAEALAARPG